MSPITDRDQIIGQLREENGNLIRQLREQGNGFEATLRQKPTALAQLKAEVTRITEISNHLNSLYSSRTAFDTFNELSHENQKEDIVERAKRFRAYLAAINSQTKSDLDEKNNESTIQGVDLEKRVAAAGLRKQRTEDAIERPQAEGARRFDETNQSKNERNESLTRLEDLERRFKRMLKYVQVLRDEKNGYRDRLDDALVELEELKFNMDGIKKRLSITEKTVEDLSNENRRLERLVANSPKDLPSRAFGGGPMKDELEGMKAPMHEKTAIVHPKDQEIGDQDDDDDTASVNQCLPTSPSSSDSSYEDLGSELEVQEL